MNRVLMTCLILALFGSLAPAVEPPSPPSHGRTRQQHEWLRGHLDADMGTIKTFPKGAFDEMHRTVLARPGMRPIYWPTTISSPARLPSGRCGRFSRPKSRRPKSFSASGPSARRSAPGRSAPRGPARG